MKRISYLSAAVALTAASLAVPAVWGINPTQPTTQPQSTIPSASYLNPSLLPSGLGYSNPAIQNDPFLSQSLYNAAPIFPNMQPNSGLISTFTPNLAVPNPDPSAYPDSSRNRLMQPNYVPPGTTPNPAQNKWRLGVYSKDLDTGVRIMDVVRGGAAQRAGLEVNDLIVAVNGYQVGYVNGQLFDCATEFARNADINGWVSMLVQNSRNGQLQVVPVQLDSRLSTLRGTVSLPNRQNLPQNALLNVELREVINNYSQPVTFASAQIANFNTYPIPFSIDFDPARLNTTGRYIVAASLVSGNREVYRTTQSLPSMMAGQPYQVAMQLEQVVPDYGSSRPLTMNQDAQVAQIVNWFNSYLGRNPTDRELAMWLESVRSGASMAQVQQELLGSNQFFNSCQGDKRVYVERVHELLVGRKPTQAELNYWISQYDSNVARRDFARVFQDAVGIQ